MSNHKKSLKMTDAQFKQKVFDLRDQWAQDSNKSNQTQAELFQLAETFIRDMDDNIDLAGGNPGPPPPRVRP